MAALTKKDIARIVEKQAPGFRVAADQSVPHRREPVHGAAMTPELAVLRKRFAKVSPRKVVGVRRVAAATKGGTTIDIDEQDNVAVIIEPKDGGGGPGPKSVLIDPKTQRIISSQG